MPTASCDDGSTAPIRVNRPKVVAEVFDGEGVIVHLGTGLYFSLDELGTPLWSLIEAGCDEAALCALLVDDAAMAPDEAEHRVRTLLAELADEDLIVVADTLEPAARPPARPIELRRFSDLQDVLLVDPIHDLDLDGDGWPVTAGSGVGRPRER
jgi:hypothetical protein